MTPQNDSHVNIIGLLILLGLILAGSLAYMFHGL